MFLFLTAVPVCTHISENVGAKLIQGSKVYLYQSFNAHVNCSTNKTKPAFEFLYLENISEISEFKKPYIHIVSYFHVFPLFSLNNTTHLFWIKHIFNIWALWFNKILYKTLTFSLFAVLLRIFFLLLYAEKGVWFLAVIFPCI